jgi:hypothetical protein
MALDFGRSAIFNPAPLTSSRRNVIMATRLGRSIRNMAVAIGAIASMTAMSGSASAHWHGGCWGCGAYAAGAVAGAAFAAPYYAPRYYYGSPVVVAPAYPACPLVGPLPYYCR